MRSPVLFILALAPAASFAQSVPRLYLGASAALISNAPFESYASSRVGPALTIGLQLDPHWAIETGVQATWRNRTDAYSGVDAPPQFSDYAYTLRTTTLLVPLLARYTFTAPSSRLHVDVLGGGYWQHAFLRSTEDVTVAANGQSYTNNYTNSYNDFGVSLGPQLRYALGTNLEAKLNLPVNLRINDYGDFGNRLLLNPQLGLQYTFGQ